MKGPCQWHHEPGAPCIHCGGYHPGFVCRVDPEKMTPLQRERWDGLINRKKKPIGLAKVAQWMRQKGLIQVVKGKMKKK